MLLFKYNLLWQYHTNTSLLRSGKVLPKFCNFGQMFNIEYLLHSDSTVKLAFLCTLKIELQNPVRFFSQARSEVWFRIDGV